ncbi:type I pantothenate kinase [Parashewanella spongiae]|uniref:Pantothenate kinase n=1 Tax=Parashewanella spongiae TaxID=342950 RepID=A0A3A6T9E0_9GAMM|nr:type I pantothenate kinase [Parashewanella spongiae]MCL1080008.1 type I pantothenate kinase [Parashewanella spongiae]RJY06003.1 type I pantothenate kinase [Parashewanella spongiae]
MISAHSAHQALYQSFQRDQWSELRNSVPMTLNEKDLEQLKGINERLSLAEVTDIYLPLSRLLNLIIKSKQQRSRVLGQFLNNEQPKTPYIISIAGSVAVGKSTTARILQALLQQWPEHPKVELLTTDGFLYPLAELKQKGLMQRKGFPESYDMKMLVDFISDIKSGKANVNAPLYSHLSYDRITDKQQSVVQPDILILEGLNVLQTGLDSSIQTHQPFVSDFVDFSIYVDADYDLLKQWYIERFLQFRDGAFANKNSYFHHYASLNDPTANDIAENIWDTINGPNLVQNILPTRERAHLILRKGRDHLMNQVLLRK